MPMPSCAHPVILVHGIDDSSVRMSRLAARLRQGGCLVYSVDLVPNNGNAGLDQLAHQLAEFIDEKLPTGQMIDLVGFSMGGLVCRYYLQRMGGAVRTRKLITLASPHHGTWLAWLRSNPGVRQMRPNSDFLRALNNDLSNLAAVDITSIWTPLDLMIVPARSSVWERAHSIQISVAAHPLVVSDRRVVDLVCRLLKGSSS